MIESPAVFFCLLTVSNSMLLMTDPVLFCYDFSHEFSRFEIPRHKMR
jgi:hypothetical protein